MNRLIYTIMLLVLCLTSGCGSKNEKGIPSNAFSVPYISSISILMP